LLRRWKELLGLELPLSALSLRVLEQRVQALLSLLW
jgi:hypothetical protein